MTHSGAPKQRWTPREAAWLGYLAGRGHSLDVIMTHDYFLDKSARSISITATRWGIPLGIGSPFAISLTGEVRTQLAMAATNAGLYPRDMAQALLAAALLDPRIVRKASDPWERA